MLLHELLASTATAADGAATSPSSASAWGGGVSAAAGAAAAEPPAGLLWGVTAGSVIGVAVTEPYSSCKYTWDLPDANG